MRSMLEDLEQVEVIGCTMAAAFGTTPAVWMPPPETGAPLVHQFPEELSMPVVMPAPLMAIIPATLPPSGVAFAPPPPAIIWGEQVAIIWGERRGSFRVAYNNSYETSCAFVEQFLLILTSLCDLANICQHLFEEHS